MTTILAGTDTENVQYDRNFYWMAVVHDLHNSLLSSVCQEPIKHDMQVG